MKTRIFTVLAIAVLMVSVMAIGTAEATTEIISPLDAYNAVNSDPHHTFIVDVRTLSEYHWVGTCALVGKGDPIAYNIPWKLWIRGIEDGKPVMKTVRGLFKWLIKKTFKSTDTIILMCRSGSRSTDAAEYLDGLEYFETIIYDMDKGFQGSANPDGYRGFDIPTVPTSWQESRLPMTQKLDPCKIWNYMFCKCK